MTMKLFFGSRVPDIALQQHPSGANFSEGVKKLRTKNADAKPVPSEANNKPSGLAAQSTGDNTQTSQAVNLNLYVPPNTDIKKGSAENIVANDANPNLKPNVEGFIDVKRDMTIDEIFYASEHNRNERNKQLLASVDNVNANRDQLKTYDTPSIHDGYKKIPSDADVATIEKFNQHNFNVFKHQNEVWIDVHNGESHIAGQATYKLSRDGHAYKVNY